MPEPKNSTTGDNGKNYPGLLWQPLPEVSTHYIRTYALKPHCLALVGSSMTMVRTPAWGGQEIQQKSRQYAGAPGPDFCEHPSH